MLARRRLLIVASIVGAALTGPAGAAAPVYRCGNRYAERPCPDGREVDVADDRSPAQRAEATRVAAGDRARALALERERGVRERAARPAVAGRLDRPATVVAPTPVRTAARKKRRSGGTLDPDNFMATDPGSRTGRR